MVLWRGSPTSSLHLLIRANRNFILAAGGTSRWMCCRKTSDMVRSKTKLCKTLWGSESHHDTNTKLEIRLVKCQQIWTFIDIQFRKRQHFGNNCECKIENGRDKYSIQQNPNHTLYILKYLLEKLCEKNKEPTAGFEPATVRLRSARSTTELRRQVPDTDWIVACRDGGSTYQGCRFWVAASLPW